MDNSTSSIASKSVDDKKRENNIPDSILGQKRRREEEKFSTYNGEEDNGNQNGKFFLGVSYENGWKVDKDQKEAAKLYRLSADQGDADGQFNLGICYENGYGVDKDMKEAVKWYRLAADQGDASGQWCLGSCYENGYGVDKDMKEAVKWYRLSADLGNARGQCNLGLCYLNGYGVDKDMKEALKWYRLSADQGSAYGQCNLGLCYLNGYGVDKDMKEAVKWFRLSAFQGNVDGQCNLGLCYENGYGVDKDMKEAVKWYRLSADQGGFIACWYLGDCYYHGLGIECNQTIAFACYQKALMMNQNFLLFGSNYEFEKGEFLGRGHAARVYKAIIKPYGKSVACKEIIFYPDSQFDEHDKRYLLDDLASESSFLRKRALLEGKILTLAPTHPNVIKIYTCHLLHDRMYLLLELADFSLHDVIYKNIEDLPDINNYRVNFTHQIAMGMNVLHEANILHADLKSSNVLIKREDNEYYAKIADFGLSSLTLMLDVDIFPQKHITAHAFISSPERFTIEQYPFMALKITHMCKKCDVYSFAMLMYELVIQRELASVKLHPLNYVPLPLQPDPEQMDFLISIRSGLRPELPPVGENESAKTHYYDLIKKCWNHEPEARPDFGEIVEYIEKYLRRTDNASPNQNLLRKFPELNYQEFRC